MRAVGKKNKKNNNTDKNTFLLKDNQKEIIKKLNKYSRGIIDSTVRSGKTLSILWFLNHIKNNNSYPNLKVLWIAYDSDEKDRHLPEEIKKWSYEESLLNNIDITLPDSLHKYSGKSYDVVIYNECQTITELVYNKLSDINYKRLYFITGTVPRKKEKVDIYKLLDLKVIYKYDMDKAVSDKILSNYRISVIKVPLDKEKNIEVKYTNIKGKKITFMTSELSSYNSISNKISNCFDARKKKNLAILRMRSLNNFDSKISIAKDLLLKKNRYLVFSQDTKNSLKISPYCYNSKTTDKYKKLFDEEKIPHLVLLNKASTGTTYKNVNGCILLSVNSSNVILEQKIGRTLLFNTEEHVADIIILISKDTIQEKWLEKSIINYDKTKIKYYDSYEDYKNKNNLIKDE